MLSGGPFGYPADYLIWWALYVSLLIHAWTFFRCFPRNRRRKLGWVLGNILVFACLLGAVALAAETYLRFVSVATDSFGMSLPARRWFALHTELNSLGCRDREWRPEKELETRRIAFVGDSFTYGWGIENPSDRFTDLLQAQFGARAPGTVEVLNVAKAGWNTSQQIQPILDMIERYDVDEVVLCYVANDIENLLPRGPEFDPIRPPMPRLVSLESSCLLDYLYRRIYLPRVPTVRNYHDWLADGFADPDIFPEHTRQLGTVIEICHSRGVTLRVALLPFIKTGGTKFNAAAVHSTLRGFFEKNGVAVVDLAPTIQGAPADALVVNRVDPHPNERAHQLFAEAIWSDFYENTSP